MGGDQDGYALFCELVDLLPELAPGQRIDARGGFIQKKHLWPVHERHSQGKALLVAQGQHLAGNIGKGRESKAVQRPLDALIAVFAAKPVGVAEKAQVMHNA